MEAGMIEDRDTKTVKKPLKKSYILDFFPLCKFLSIFHPTMMLNFQVSKRKHNTTKSFLGIVYNLLFSRFFEKKELPLRNKKK